jgi:A/G-specific adenine glycosylase
LSSRLLKTMDLHRLHVKGFQFNRAQLLPALLEWYDSQSRRLPWRGTKDPYAIWVSEIMLQQTQVETVIPYYHRFLQRFPSVEALAAAPNEEVLKTWENLGYYTRARNLHKAAGLIATQFAGRIPDRWDEIIQLPGIGRYTAGAILSIAFGQRVPAVDGNVRRVISRLGAVEESIDDPPGQERIEQLVCGLIPGRDPGRFNQALMELGALVCTPKKPGCSFCPLRALCRALARGLTHRLPLRGKRRALPHKEVAAAIIQNSEGLFLIVQRPASGLLGSLWKFPGDILDPGEAPADGLRRTVRTELGIDIASGPQLARVKHAYTHFRITLSAYACTLLNGPPVAATGRAWRWVTTRELDALPLSKADRMIARGVALTG